MTHNRYVAVARLALPSEPRMVVAIGAAGETKKACRANAEKVIHAWHVATEGPEEDDRKEQQSIVILKAAEAAKRYPMEVREFIRSVGCLYFENPSKEYMELFPGIAEE